MRPGIERFKSKIAKHGTKELYHLGRRELIYAKEKEFSFLLNPYAKSISIF
jgi:hypothetical protein